MNGLEDTNGTEWFVHDDDGEAVVLRGTTTGGLVVVAGDEREAGLVVLDGPAVRRLIAASWDLLDGLPVNVDERARDVMPEHFPFPWWAIDSTAGDGIRRGAIVSRTGTGFVVVVGRVKAGPGNTGAVSLDDDDARRFMEAALAIVEGRDPWTVAP